MKRAILVLLLPLFLLLGMPTASAVCQAHGKACTADMQCCPGTVCAWGNVCQPGCRIPGNPTGRGSLNFYQPNQVNPANACQSCQPSRSMTSWSTRPAGTACGSSSSSQCDLPDSCNSSGQCLANNKPNSLACNDANACTQTDSCQAGVCAGTNPIVCPTVCHEPGTCNPANGQCPAARSDGYYCDDGNACTQTDGCVAGACVGADPVVCAATAVCYLPGICNQATGICPPSTVVAPDDTLCGASECTTTRCEAGACTRVTDKPLFTPCGDEDDCEEEYCVGSSCQYLEDAPDGSECNPPSTSADCVTGYCDTGECFENPDPAAANGDFCSDADRCTLNDACQNGVCAGTPAANGTVCGSAAGPCRAQTCQAGTCADDPDPAKADGFFCDDGDACSKVDRCQAGICHGAQNFGDGTPCNDQEPCTNGDICQSGVCHGSNKPNGTSCADGEGVCTTGDHCQSGVCVGTNAADGTACDPGEDVCTTGAFCQGGTCAGTSAPELTSCNDGLTCNQAPDTCRSGECVGEECHAYVECNGRTDCGAFETAGGTGCVCTAAPPPFGGPCSSYPRCSLTGSCAPGTVCVVSCCSEPKCLPLCPPGPAPAARATKSAVPTGPAPPNSLADPAGRKRPGT